MSVLLEALTRVEAHNDAAAQAQQEAQTLARATTTPRDAPARSLIVRIGAPFVALGVLAALAYPFVRERLFPSRVPISPEPPSPAALSSPPPSATPAAPLQGPRSVPAASRPQEGAEKPSPLPVSSIIAAEVGQVDRPPAAPSAPERASSQTVAPTEPTTHTARAASSHHAAATPSAVSVPPPASAEPVPPTAAPPAATPTPKADTPARLSVTPANSYRYQRAWRAWEEGRLEVARAELDTLLAAEPNHREAQLLRVLVLDALGEEQAARSALAALEAAAPNPLDPALVEARARLLLRAGALEEAQTLLQSAVAHRPESRPLLALLGVTALARGDGATAERTYQTLATLEPTERRWWLGLIAALEAEGRSGEALELRRRLAERTADGVPLGE